MSLYPLKLYSISTRLYGSVVNTLFCDTRSLEFEPQFALGFFFLFFFLAIILHVLMFDCLIIAK